MTSGIVSTAGLKDKPWLRVWCKYASTRCIAEKCTAAGLETKRANSDAA